MLYNVGPPFRSARNGTRFERRAPAPAGPNDAEYAFSYRYELASTSDPFAHWQCGRTLAAFDWIGLHSASNPKLAHVWLAIARCRAQARSKAVELGYPDGARSPYGSRYGRRRGANPGGETS